MHLILASASPRRAELLTAAGYFFEVRPVDIDERVREGERPRAYVERLATEKTARAFDVVAEWTTATVGRSSSAAHGAPEVVVLGADTAVVVDDTILGKPRDVEHGARMLRQLSGRTHQVMTGVSARSATSTVVLVEVTEVTFGQLTEDQIAWYVESGEGRDKAGGYAIQGLGARFVPKIVGSYSNVVGLPIAAVDGLLRRLSWPPGVLASHG